MRTDIKGQDPSAWFQVKIPTSKIPTSKIQILAVRNLTVCMCSVCHPSTYTSSRRYIPTYIFRNSVPSVFQRCSNCVPTVFPLYVWIRSFRESGRATSLLLAGDRTSKRDFFVHTARKKRRQLLLLAEQTEKLPRASASTSSLCEY